MLDRIINDLGDWNPQLFREVKGRLQFKELISASIVSILGQIVLLLFWRSGCNYDHLSQGVDCWLGLFLFLSVIGIIFILVVGTYLVIEDLSQEAKKGTLGFIRLSPQSCSTIISGKILGVPILLYWMMLLALPLQLIAGLKAGIPLILILAFNLTVALSCFFYYSVGSLLGLLNRGGASYSLIIPTILCIYLFIGTMNIYTPYGEATGTSLDWLGLFYPGKVLTYLVQASANPDAGYINFEHVTKLNWYNLHLWRSPLLGIPLIMVNFGVCTYWIWQALKRCFSNLHSTLLSKNQSYWFSTTTMAIIFGFALETQNPERMYEEFVIVLFFHLVLILGLAFALTNQRQVLQDWSRYRRHQSVVTDLLFGEKSPSSLAISINALISGVVILPGVLLLFGTYTPVVILGLLSQVILLVIYGLVIQLILLRRSAKRQIWAIGTIFTMILLPPISLGILGLLPHTHSQLWVFVPLSLQGLNHGPFSQFILPFIFQGLIITVGSWVLTKQVQRLGESETKAIG